MHRKEFIKTCGVLCVGGSIISTILEGCASANYYARFTTEGEKLLVKKSEFIDLQTGKEKGQQKEVQRKYVLIKSDKYSFPICLYKKSETAYTALLMECTHKSCELQPHGEYLICPCHGSEFSNTGVVQNPPAEENLKSFKITIDNEHIYIHI